MLNKEERKFLRTHLRLNEDPWGLLYLLFKVHKNPLKTRPVVSYCGNLLHPLGQLITEWLQRLANMWKSYFQDYFTLKKELDLQEIPSNELLFSCDATSMYTNIRTSFVELVHGISEGFLAYDDRKDIDAHLCLIDVIELYSAHLAVHLETSKEIIFEEYKKTYELVEITRTRVTRPWQQPLRLILLLALLRLKTLESRPGDFSTRDLPQPRKPTTNAWSLSKTDPLKQSRHPIPALL